MSIHEAVLQPIAAFVYCNRHAAAAAVAGRQTSEISARHATSKRLRNWSPPMGLVSLKLFYDGTTREIK